MKKKFSLALAGLLLLLCASCGEEAVPEPTPPVETPVESEQPAVPQEPDTDASAGKPTIPADVAEGIEYMYDFLFVEWYDAKITAEFSLTFPDTVSVGKDTLFLYESYRDESDTADVVEYHSDGMAPYSNKNYCYTNDNGGLIVGADYYEPDDVEYLSYFWTDVEGVETSRGVAVGSTERELLSAYTGDLYYVPYDRAEPDFISFTEEHGFELEFDYAYAWQPFTHETNDIRDITFYIKDGKVKSIEMMRPYELRYVYGFDSEAALRETFFARYQDQFTDYTYNDPAGVCLSGRSFALEDVPANILEEMAVNNYYYPLAGKFDAHTAMMGSEDLEISAGNEQKQIEVGEGFESVTVHTVALMDKSDIAVGTSYFDDDATVQRCVDDLVQSAAENGLAEQAVVYMDLSWEWTQAALEKGPQLGDGRYERLYLFGKKTADDIWKLYDVFWGEYSLDRVIE